MFIRNRCIVIYIIKFTTMCFVYTIAIFLIHNYHTVQNYTDKLHKQLNIFIFFNNNHTDIQYVNNLINNSGLILKKYMNSKNAYLEAINKNKFLKDIASSGISDQLPAYAIVQPKCLLLNNTFLQNIINKLNKDLNVDEIVFDANLFTHYIATTNNLLIYRKLVYMYVICSLLLIILKLVVNKYIVKKIFINIKILATLLALICSFFVCKILWLTNINAILIYDSLLVLVSLSIMLIILC